MKQSGVIGKLTAYGRLLRPGQWVKSAFVPAPLFFGGALFNANLAVQALVATVAFSLVASSVYCINDLIDAPKDRLHPVKRRRPIASGAVSGAEAVALSAVTLAAGVALPLAAGGSNDISVSLILLGYWLLNLGYCLGLKRVALLDVFIIALGFVLRLYAGGAATHITPSAWLTLMTLLLTLFLGFAKRRDDVLLMNRTGVQMRHNIGRYNLLFLDQTLSILLGALLICYIQYTMSDDLNPQNGHSSLLYLTVIPVLFALLRYLQLTQVFSKSGSPTKVLYSDAVILICLLIWILLFASFLYLPPLL